MVRNMAELSMHELEVKYNLTIEQKERIRVARNKRRIKFIITQEETSKVTGLENPYFDSKINIVKYDEDEIKRFLKI
jgi:hypothetical protein